MKQAANKMLARSHAPGEKLFLVADTYIIDLLQ